MSEARDPGIDALIHQARREFAQGLVARAADLETMVARGAWADVRRAAHRLRGSAGIYGFVALGAIAAALDELLLQTDGKPDVAARALVQDKVGQLRALAEIAIREVP